MNAMNTKQQGAIGVARALRYFADQGYAVFIPVSDTSRYDLIVDTGEVLKRVEVKTTTSSRGAIELRTHGGNQSWSGEYKRISSEDCDWVFAVNLNTGTEKVFEASELHGRRSVRVH